MTEGAPIRVLIADDHALFREGLASIIRSEPDIEITGLAGSVREARLAGSRHASRATAESRSATDANVIGSPGLTPRSWLLSICPAAKAAKLPMTSPISASVMNSTTA